MAQELFDVVGEGPGEETSVVVRVHVQPGAGRSEVGGRHGDALRIRVAAPPVQERANRECVEVLARLLGVPAGRVEIVSGSRARDKRVRVAGVDPDEVRRRLQVALIERETPGSRPGAGRSPR